MSLVICRAALRYACLRALMSCLISRFTHGLSEALIRTSFERTYLYISKHLGEDVYIRIKKSLPVS